MVGGGRAVRGEPSYASAFFCQIGVAMVLESQFHHEK